ncbi:MAG: hypothetical protein ACRDZY_04795 [Acidimicrobiales bacterium]
MVGEHGRQPFSVLLQLHGDGRALGGHGELVQPHRGGREVGGQLLEGDPVADVQVTGVGRVCAGL